MRLDKVDKKRLSEKSLKFSDIGESTYVYIQLWLVSTLTYNYLLIITGFNIYVIY